MTHRFATGTVTLLIFSLTGACSSGGDDPEANESQGAGGFADAADAGLGSGGQFSSNGGVFAGSGGSSSPPGTGGRVGSAGRFGTGGVVGNAGMVGASGGADGVGGADGMGAAGGTDPGTGGKAGGGGGGTGCCPDGNCLCHGPDPTDFTFGSGPFATANFRVPTGTVYYPTDAEPPFAAVATCGGFTSTGPQMASWGPFYASHGIVMVDVTVASSDQPEIRATKLLAAIEELKGENADGSSPLSGKMSGRYGTSGHSMCGGGTTIASGDDPTLKTSVGLAAWGPDGSGVQVPTLLLCGTSDTTAPCTTSQDAYDTIPASTPKMMVSIPGANHFSWFDPASAGEATSGKYALAFQKVFLEGDERWRPLLLESPPSGTQTTNIQ